MKIQLLRQNDEKRAKVQKHHGILLDEDDEAQEVTEEIKTEAVVNNQPVLDIVMDAD